ncbi:hypothetical protein ZHAS_00022176 [Anopheles sinensis]|uniref:Uncharacterized protein n=1 Tax=Anopheles sinensis TaxID=74873 RepID=A0A084WUN7_ANOSI|nr:hypothetical protein ZHAS_00022176 [Anopheles sinensis]
MAAVCARSAALNENINIDIKVDTDSKLYHQAKTVEGSFNYGYNVPRQNYNQFQHKVKGPDGVTYGCYGFVDPTNGTHLYHYVSDLKGYRVVPPNRPTKVYTERVANSVADIYDSVGIQYDWEKLYFPDVCRVLQRSKEERNELSIPPGFKVNDDGTVTQTTTSRPAPPSTTTTRRPPPTPPATTRPTTPRTTPPARKVTPATPRPTPPKPRPTPARELPRTTPRTTRAPVRTAPPTVRPTPPRTTPQRVQPPTNPPRKLVTTPKPVPRFPNTPATTPKTSGNKFGNNRDNFIGLPATNNAETLKPPPGDLAAVGQEITELRTLLQMLLRSLNKGNNTPNSGPDCDPGLGAVDPNAKQVFLPLVIVDSLPGAPRGSPGPAGVPTGSQFAIPSVGYGPSRCNTCG